MHKKARVALTALAAAVGIAGCSDWLTGPKLTTDPNRPQDANASQLLTAVQATQFTLQEGALARLMSMWTQQMSGTTRQYISQALYSVAEGDFEGEWASVYTGGGIIDLRRIDSLSLTLGDRTFAGISKVWEALTIGTATDIWGDVPYSEAIAGVDNPKLDPQADVYAAIQTRLDEAIADLSSGEGPGPGSIDLVFNGDPAPWIEVAHTLKARYYMHMAEVDPSNYALALAEAQQGISTPANNFTSVHTTATNEQNIWYQFVQVQRSGYISPAKTIIDTMLARGDPRLPEYFAPSGGTFIGAPEGAEFEDSFSELSAERVDPAFDQPLVTWAENQLIIAEAAFQTSQEPIALGALNAERTTAGLGTVSSSGPQLLHDIMIEKWIALFQSIESFNDYKRTCLPNLEPVGGATFIPGRLLYPFNERNTNPNVPSPSQQPLRNPNDPANLTTAAGGTCFGQANTP